MDSPNIGFLNKQTHKRIVQPYEKERKLRKLTKEEEDQYLEVWVKLVDSVTSDGDYIFFAPPVTQEFFSPKPFIDNETQAIMWVNSCIKNAILNHDDDAFDIWVTSKWAEFYIQRDGYSHFLEICKHGTPHMLQTLKSLGKLDLIAFGAKGLISAKQSGNQPVVKLLSSYMDSWFENYLSPSVVQDVKGQITSTEWKYYENGKKLSSRERANFISYLRNLGVTSENIKLIMDKFP